MREPEREGRLRGEVEHVIVRACLCESEQACVCVCLYMCQSSVRVLCKRVFILPCLLLSDATSNCVSWATRGPCYVFFFFFFLSSQETRTNCCAVAIGAGRFVFPPLSSLVPPHRQLP